MVEETPQSGALEDLSDCLDIFQEPSGYYKPPKAPTRAQHTLKSGQVIEVNLVGENPLWGHLLWNAGRTISDFLETRDPSFLHGKNVLELGAGAGLPSLVCAIHAASKVVVTDYPDIDLIKNLELNIKTCDLISSPRSIYAEGYLWGANPSKLLSYLPRPDQGFDILILADLLFNHSEHAKLVFSVTQTLKKSSDARALVFFTPYRPWLLEKDLAFFDLAKEAGFSVNQILEKVMDKVMFDEDPGDELLRQTVYGYELKWKTQLSSG